MRYAWLLIKMISWVSSGKLVMPHWIDRLKRKNCTKIPDRERSQIWVVRLWPQWDNFQLGCFCSLWFNSYKSFHAMFTFNADTSDNVLSLILILKFLMFLKSSASNLAHLVIFDTIQVKNTSLCSICNPDDFAWSIHWPPFSPSNGWLQMLQKGRFSFWRTQLCSWPCRRFFLWRFSQPSWFSPCCCRCLEPRRTLHHWLHLFVVELAEVEKMSGFK